VPRYNFISLLRILPPFSYFIGLTATTLVYVLIDTFPIYRFFSNLEPQILQILWQTLVWGLYSVFICFFIVYFFYNHLKLSNEKPSFFNFFCKYFYEFLTTRLRVALHVSLWLLVFVLPGIFMILKLCLSEVVVFLNPNFLEDKTQDPLTISSQKIGFKFLPLVVLFLLLLVLPSIFDSIFNHAHLLYEPQGRIFQIFLYTLLSFVSYIYMISLFLNLNSKEKQNV
jgi:hypothetical protein